MKFTRIAAAGLLAVTALASQASNLLVNGSFEDLGGAVAQGWGGYTFGSGYTPTMPGWTIDPNGSIDVTVTGSQWGPAQDGNNSIDINGWNPGSISQSVATSVGQAYLVSFFYSRNPAGASDPATATVSAGGAHLDVSAANDGSYGSAYAMVWKPASFSFTAGSTSSLVSLTATSGGNGGVFFDNVSVTAVPEPASLALMGSGVGVLMLLARRRRAA